MLQVGSLGGGGRSTARMQSTAISEGVTHTPHDRFTFRGVL